MRNLEPNSFEFVSNKKSERQREKKRGGCGGVAVEISLLLLTRCQFFFKLKLDATYCCIFVINQSSMKGSEKHRECINFVMITIQMTLLRMRKIIENVFMEMIKIR